MRPLFGGAAAGAFFATRGGPPAEARPLCLARLQPAQRSTAACKKAAQPGSARS